MEYRKMRYCYIQEKIDGERVKEKKDSAKLKNKWMNSEG